MAQADATAGDNRLLPLMREAVLMVRMLLHRQLLQDFAAQRPELAPEDRVRLAGALINDLFGTVPADESVVAFARAQRALVEAAMRGLAAHSGKLRPLITDALRMHCICDGQEGVNTTASLLMARAIGLLEEERPMPMPSTFMLAVRAAAVAEGLVLPMAPARAEAASRPLSPGGGDVDHLGISPGKAAGVADNAGAQRGGDE